MNSNSELLKKIQNGNPELLAEAVKEIKENGNLSIAQMLLENLGNIRDAHTLTTIVNLLADIKENAFREILINALQSASQPSIKTELLRIIWESSLDYSRYLPIFLDILQNDDFTTAFEASTVIENMVYNLTTEQHQQLHEFIETFPGNKQFLVENIHTEMGCCEND